MRKRLIIQVDIELVVLTTIFVVCWLLIGFSAFFSLASLPSFRSANAQPLATVIMQVSIVTFCGIQMSAKYWDVIRARSVNEQIIVSTDMPSTRTSCILANMALGRGYSDRDLEAAEKSSAMPIHVWGSLLGHKQTQVPSPHAPAYSGCECPVSYQTQDRMPEGECRIHSVASSGSNEAVAKSHS